MVPGGAEETGLSTTAVRAQGPFIRSVPLCLVSSRHVVSVSALQMQDSLKQPNCGRSTFLSELLLRQSKNQDLYNLHDYIHVFLKPDECVSPPGCTPPPPPFGVSWSPVPRSFEASRSSVWFDSGILHAGREGGKEGGVGEKKSLTCSFALLVSQSESLLYGGFVLFQLAAQPLTFSHAARES